MATDLSKKGWAAGLVAFTFIGLVIIAKAAKAGAQSEPRSNYQNNLSFPS